MAEAGPPELDVIAAFLANYQQTRSEWETFKDHALACLKRAAKEENIASQIIARTKETEKVEKKLRKRQAFYKYESEKHILNNMVDFVGLRISAYFPNDQEKILRLIDKKFITIATVRFEDDEERYTLSENVSDDTGNEIVGYINQRYEEARERHKKESTSDTTISSTPEFLDDGAGKEMLAYIKRKFKEGNDSKNLSLASEACSDHESINHETEADILAYINQKHVTALAKHPKSFNPAKKPPSKEGVLNNYQRRFGGYTAEHRWVILRPDQRDAGNSLHLQPIEIQVRSVLMDSWIAINRDIEYDALTGVLSTQERRILDSIKGLAQTGELLLEQLHYANTQRLKLDQKRFERPEDVTTALLDYLEVDESLAGFPEQPFAELLLYFLRAIGIYTVGDLKVNLRNNNISANIREEIAIFFESFPMMRISLHPYILWKVFQTMQPHHVKKLCYDSGLGKQSFAALVEYIMFWIICYGDSIGDQQRALSSCGYQSLTLLLNLFVWTRENKVSTYFARYTAQASLVAGLFDPEQRLTPFLTVALLHGVLGLCADPSDPNHPFKAASTLRFASNVKMRESASTTVVRELAVHPIQWECGVTQFLQYSRLFLSKMAKEDGGDCWSESMEKTGDEISTSMARWIAKRCSLSDINRMVQSKKHTTASYASSRAFWERISEHLLAEEFDDLPVKKQNDSIQWTTSMTAPFSQHSASIATDQGQRVYNIKELTLFIVDCMNLTNDEVYEKLQHAIDNTPSGIDVIFLKHAWQSLLLHKLNGTLRHGRNILDHYYHGCLHKIPMGRVLMTFVDMKRYAPAGVSSKAGELGRLWKVNSQQENKHALVCDLLIHVEPGAPPVRLRLPNCLPGTQIDSTFLPSAASWVIKGRRTLSEEDEVLDPSVLIGGARTNCDLNENSYTMTFIPEGRDEGREMEDAQDAEELRNSLFGLMIGFTSPIRSYSAKNGVLPFNPLSHQ